MIGASERFRRVFEIAFFCLLFAVVFYFRLPSFSDAMCDPDQGEVGYAAKLLLAGHCPYGEAILTKPPSSLVIYAALFALFGPHMLAVHLFAALWAFVTCVMLYVLGKRHLNTFTGVTAAGLYAFYQAEILSGGLCANYEYWSVLPALVSLHLARNDNVEGREWRMFGVGVAAGLSAMAKQTAVVFFAAALAFIVVIWWRSNRLRGFSTLVSSLALAVVGFVSAIAVFFPIFVAVNCVEATAHELNPLVLKNYLGAITRQQQWGFFTIQMSRLWRSVACLACLVFVSLGAVLATYKTRKNLSLFGGALLYALAGAASIFSGGRFYGHYFTVIFPFLCLVVAVGFGSVTRKWPRKWRWALLAPLLLCGAADSYGELRLAHLSADSLRRTGSVMSQEIFSDNRHGGIEYYTANQMINQLEWDASYRQIGEMVKAQLQPGEAIWCYDYTPEIYYHADAWAPTKHNENFDVVTSCSDPWFGSWHGTLDQTVLNHRERLMRELSARPPTFIFRYKMPCPGGVYDFRRPQKIWPLNANGQPMAFCPCKMETFPELQYFLDVLYDILPPETNGAIEIYRLREGGADNPFFEESRSATRK